MKKLSNQAMKRIKRAMDPNGQDAEFEQREDPEYDAILDKAIKGYEIESERIEDPEEALWKVFENLRNDENYYE